MVYRVCTSKIWERTAPGTVRGSSLKTGGAGAGVVFPATGVGEGFPATGVGVGVGVWGWSGLHSGQIRLGIV